MQDRVYFSDELLQPISPTNPAGRDMRYEPLFGQILEARRADDQLDAGAWEKEGGRKAAEWHSVADLALEAIKNHTKDLRLACFLTEAAIRLDGFEGLRDCLRLTKELIYRFWDHGLLPAIEDGDLDYRANALGWLNENMPDVMRVVPITARGNREENYSFSRYLQARQMGTEESIQRASADFKSTASELRQQGWITMDTFDAAMKATKRDAFEAIYRPFEESYEQFQALEKLVDAKFGQSAPSFTAAKETFEEIRRLLAATFKRKSMEEPTAPLDGLDGQIQTRPGATVVGLWTAGMPEDSGGSWHEAEALVRAGSVEQGIQRMAALAAQETSTRGRFLRKLMLVDVCRTSGRERLARSILEELNQQITEYKLEHWESTALVGAVWSRLYRIYKKLDGKEQDQAATLYNQLCRLDPWQTYLDCED